MSVATILADLDRRDAERRTARDRLAEAAQRALPADWFSRLGPEPCSHPKDALGHCLGSCQGEEWDR